MTRYFAILTALVVSLHGFQVHGNEQVPPQAAARAPSPAEVAWGQAYAKARTDLEAGRFAAASEQFQALVVSAPDSASRLVAIEMLGLSLSWSRQGLSLVPPGRLALGPQGAPQDRRTVDELSVLYLTSVLYGVYSGIVFDVHNESNSAAGNVLPPLLGAAASAGVVALLDHKLKLGYGVANSIVTGMILGFEEAYAWSLWHEAYSPYNDEWGYKTVLTLPWVLGTVGAIAGGIAGNAVGTTPGRASFMGSGALWGALVAGTTTAAFMGEHGSRGEEAAPLLVAALALNAGALGTAWVGSTMNPSVARVRFMDLGALSGGLLFGGLYLSMADKGSDYRPFMGSLATGMLSGFALAWYLTRNMDPDRPRKDLESSSVTSRILPTILPTQHGAGALIGVAGTL